MNLLLHSPFKFTLGKASQHRWAVLAVFGFAILFAQPVNSGPVEAATNQQASAEAAGVVSVDPSLFTTQTFQWKDVARDRSVPAKLYLPVGLKLSAGGLPLVVFSHGIGGSMDGYSYLGRYFAAHGYASLHVQHVGSDRQIWRGNLLTLASRLSDAAQDTEALNRVKDVKFALDSAHHRDSRRHTDTWLQLWCSGSPGTLQSHRCKYAGRESVSSFQRWLAQHLYRPHGYGWHCA